MKKITKFFLLISLTTMGLEFQTINVLAQSMELKWAVKDSSHAYSQGLICDKDSNLYSYGDYREYTTSGSLFPAGSFLEKFSTQGNLILMKKWPVASFSIQKIIYDGGQYFYFTGFFFENCTLDGISISCKGNKDGMIGKMDISGTILWVTTFGSSKDEMGYGLCFGPSNNSLILSGSTTDSLIVNNVFVDKGQQSMLFAQFSLSGTLQNHKLYDFFPQRDGGNDLIENAGKEIYSASGGNYFVLADRQGSRLPTYPDSVTGVIEGEYVMKLNAAFDTLWTKYIVGPSDWGSGARSLQVSAAGDPYLVSVIGSHYGAEYKIQRLDPNNGAVTWSETHNDGGFSDIFLDGNTLFTCGTDSAYHCPCPDADYGYQNVKTFNSNNVMTDILKFNGPLYKENTPPYHSKYITFQRITRDNFGNTFIRGGFDFQYIVFGNDTIQADTTNNNGYSGTFLLKLSDKTTTGIPSVVSENKNILSVYPNPSNNAFTINFSASAKGKLILNIVNELGAVIYSESKRDFSGEYVNIIDLSKQPKGIYFVEMLCGEKRETKKIIIQ